MTKKEAAIVSAYTGYLIGDFTELHKYIEKIMKRPVMTHELGDSDTFKTIQKKSKNDFVKINIKD